MRKENLLTMALVLIVLLAGVIIKSFGHPSSSTPTRHANAIPTRADAAEVRAPTMKVMPAPAIGVDVKFFVGAGDGSAGSWVRP